MSNQKANAAILGITVTAIAVVALVAAAVVASQTFTNTGAVKGIGVNIHWDADCTRPTSTIDWGLFSSGESKSITLYVKNPGSISETLRMTTSNWSSSSAQSKITVSWNLEGYLLEKGKPVQAVLTLSVDEDATNIDQFAFDITITGTSS